jgi:hypothetical protein
MVCAPAGGAATAPVLRLAAATAAAARAAPAKRLIRIPSAPAGAALRASQDEDGR